MPITADVSALLGCSEIRITLSMPIIPETGQEDKIK